MLDWLRQRGVHEERLVYVPCCVNRIAFSEEARSRRRGELGIEGKVVFAYAGTIAAYQHIEDGLLPFFEAAARVSSSPMPATLPASRMRAGMRASSTSTTRLDFSSTTPVSTRFP